MLLVINGVEDSELALDLGHVFLTHSCGSMCVDWGYMGSVWMEGHRYKGRVDAPHQGRTWVLGPGSSSTLLPTGPASEAWGLAIYVSHTFS